ncbi:hypothetical protein Neosp_012810 [[Neocosmospora] mangrovei]
MPVPSRALVVRGGDGLHIYMNAQDIRSNCVPPEVAESLSACCNIPERSITTLVVLTCKEENIEGELAWRGVYNPIEDDLYPDFDEDEEYNEESAGKTSAIEKPKVQPEEGPDPPNAQPRPSTAQGPLKEVKVDELSLSPPGPGPNAQQTPDAEAVDDIPPQARRRKKNKNRSSEPNDIFEGPSKPGEGKSASRRTMGPPEQEKEPLLSTTPESLKEGIGHNIENYSYQHLMVQHLSSLNTSTCSTASLAQKNNGARSWRTLANSTPAGGIPPPPKPSVRPRAKPLSEVVESFSQPANSVKIDDLAQLPYVHGMDNRFSLTGRANMIFVPDPQDLPQLSSTARSNPNGFTVSNRLKELLGDRYTEEKHWTSPMRCHLTQGPFNSGEPKRATFTIASADGANLTEFLVRNSYKRAKEWREECPNYHIEVHATAGGRRSPLVMKTSVMEMARQYRLRHTYEPQNDVFILICIFNSQEEPKLRLYVDPWALYSAGKLKLTVKADYLNSYHVSIDRGIGIRDPEWTDVARRKQGYAQPARGGSPARRPSPAAKSYYFAISYAWGSSLKQFSLWTPQGRIPLTASLYLGLKRLRRKQGKVWLWADAICINQDDREGDDEKARQIVLMTNIFQSAVRVYIWLGEDEDESDVAIQFLEEIAPIASGETDGQVPKHSPNFPKVEDPKWSILAKLLERKWFRRVWVAQELVLAREAIVVCGALQMPWDRFHGAVEACFSVVEGEGYSFLLPRQTRVAAVLHLGAFRHDYYNDRDKCGDLLMLLERFHMAEATRQRDKLFALLSLAKDGKNYTPDYKKPLEDIITHFAGVLVKNGRAMDLLYRARGYSKKFPEFPSWIPNWISSPYPDTISRWPDRTHGHPYAAATSVDSDTELIGSTLYIDGYKLDSIKVLGKCRSSINEIRSYLDEIFSTVDKVYSDLTEDKRREIKCQLPIGNASKASRGGNWHKGDRLASFFALTNYLERHKEVDMTESHKLLSLRRPDIPTVSDANLRQLQPYMFTVLDFAELFSSAVVAVTNNQHAKIEYTRNKSPPPESDKKELSLDVEAKFKKLKKSIAGENEVAISVTWTGGGQKLKNQEQDWDFDTMKDVALKFPDLCAKTPMRTHAPLTKYTALRSFYAAQNFDLPVYDKTGTYTNVLREAYLDYKAILGQIQFLAFDVSDGKKVLVVNPRAVKAVEQAKAIADKEGETKNDKSAQETSTGTEAESVEGSIIDVTGSAPKTTPAKVIDAPTATVEDAFAPTIAGLEEARLQCLRRFANRSPYKIDNITIKPEIATDETRPSPYLSPFLFKLLLTPGVDLPAENSQVAQNVAAAKVDLDALAGRFMGAAS